MNLSESAFCKWVTVDELSCLHINHPKFFAEIASQGAQLTQYKHREQGDYIWLSPAAKYKNKQSLRGGIPICWPWFGVLEKNPDSVINGVIGEQGAHGFARIQDWTLVDIQESAHSVMVEFCLSESEATLKIWPYSFELRCRFYMGEDLTVELINLNTGDTPFELTQALHTYLGINDLPNLKIQGAHQKTYIDALDGWKTKQQRGNIQINEEVDRIYLGEIQYQILDDKQMLQLTSNSESGVVWNPWIEKSKRLSQFPEIAYQNMLCIESGNLLDDRVRLLPQARHTLRMTLKRISK